MVAGQPIYTGSQLRVRQQIKIMKSKFGGLNNFLNASVSTPRGQLKPVTQQAEPVRDRSNSRNGQYREQHNKRKYDDLRDDRYGYRVDSDVDNEEDMVRSKHGLQKSRRESVTVKRTNSRDILGTLHSPRDRDYDEPRYHQQPTASRSRVQTKRDMTQSQYANFQHVHQQTRHCVELLLKKTGNSIHNLNQTINEFKQNLKRIVQDEFIKLQKTIMNTIETIFNNEMENIRKLCKIEQKKTTKSINEVREELEKIYEHLQKMKEGIDGPNWKRFAGDFFKDDIQSQVDHLVTKSQKLQVNRTVHLNFDPRKEEDFRTTLQKLLQVHLSTTLETEAF